MISSANAHAPVTDHERLMAAAKRTPTDRLPTAPDEVAVNAPKKRFIRGPIDWAWITACSRLPGRSLHVAMALAFESGLKNSMTVALRPSTLRELGVDADAARRALNELESAGVIRVARRGNAARIVTIQAPNLLKPIRKGGTRTPR